MNINQLTSAKRRTAFVIDDSMFERNRSKQVELPPGSRIMPKIVIIRAFMPTMGWSDGHTFIPTDFTLLSSAKALNRINGNIDKRTSGTIDVWKP